jgi:hypothetical protein
VDGGGRPRRVQEGAHFGFAAEFPRAFQAIDGFGILAGGHQLAAALQQFFERGAVALLLDLHFELVRQVRESGLFAQALAALQNGVERALRVAAVAPGSGPVEHCGNGFGALMRPV